MKGFLGLVIAVCLAASASSGGKAEDTALRADEAFYLAQRTEQEFLVYLEGSGWDRLQPYPGDADPSEIWVIIHGWSTPPDAARSLGLSVGGHIRGLRPNDTIVVTAIWNGLANFGASEANADAAGVRLGRLISSLQERHPEARTAIIAHSLGARVALGATRRATRPIDLVALVQGAVRATSIHTWTAEPIRVRREPGDTSEWPTERCRGEFADALTNIRKLVLTQAEEDQVLRRAFGADDAFRPHVRRCFVPMIANRAGLLSMGDAVGQRAIGLPFAFDEQDMEILEYMPPPMLDPDAPLNRALRGLDPFGGYDDPDLIFPEIEAIWNFEWVLEHDDVTIVDLHSLLPSEPGEGWHSPLRGNSGDVLVPHIAGMLGPE